MRSVFRLGRNNKGKRTKSHGTIERVNDGKWMVVSIHLSPSTKLQFLGVCFPPSPSLSPSITSFSLLVENAPRKASRWTTDSGRGRSRADFFPEKLDDQSFRILSSRHFYSPSRLSSLCFPKVSLNVPHLPP